MPNAHSNLYEFDKFRLDVDERILWRESEKLPLSEKAFDTLCALVRHGNHLISKDELLNEIWAGAFVEENNLDKNISILRKTLGERAGKGKFIETVRGHGFRFVPEVRELSEPSASAGGLNTAQLQIENLSNDALENKNQSEIEHLKSEIPKAQSPKTKNQKLTSLIAIALAILAGLSFLGLYAWRGNVNPAPDTPIKSVAVLPFKSLVTDNRNESLELGMADALISKLSDGEEIIVRPLDSVRRSASTETDSLTVGRALQTEAVLDGSIQTAGERIRISARLLRTSDGKQLWAGQFDEKFTDIFAVQDSISRQVAAALKIRLGGKDKKRQTENVEAYQLYMKGRFHLLKGIQTELETGVSYFEQAIAADPNYALAYAGLLADAYRGFVVGGEKPSAEFMPKAKAAALRAIELDDTLAEAHTNLGHILFWYEWNWAEAEKQHRRALELDPNSADALQFYTHLLSCTGRHAEALATIKRAREIDPLNLRINALEGLFLLHAGKIDESIAALRKALELEPNYRLSNVFIARAYIEKGMYTEAAAAIRTARKASPESSETIAYGTYALAKSGNIAEARAALDELLKASSERYVPPYNIALIYNALGETETALNYLEKAFAEKDVRMVWLKVEPKWNNLRDAPRFIELIRRMNF
ncbi:hypothetical protein BH10ACI1_BH10ACI1_17890 [soil metagenome]